MSADTGARERFLEASVAVWREIDALTDANGGVYPGLPQSHDLRVRERQAWEQYRAALAAGVGVPPDGDLVSAPAKERQGARDELKELLRRAFVRENELVHALRVIANGGYGDASVKAKAALAGVGEARPAEPATMPAATRLDDDGVLRQYDAQGLEVGAPAEEQPDARADNDFRAMHLFTGGLTAESRTHRPDCPACAIARLREQLDAARQALDAAADTFERIESVARHPAKLQNALDAIAEAAWTEARAARAALGVVAAAETSGSALDQRAVETRGGGSEA